MSIVKELIERLQKEDPEKVIAVSIWNVEDVKYSAEGYDVELTKEQCETILGRVHRHQDCEIGINWDVIASHIEIFLGEQE